MAGQPTVTTGVRGGWPLPATCNPTDALPPAGSDFAQSAPTQRMRPPPTVQVIPHALTTDDAPGSAQLIDQAAAAERADTVTSAT